MDRAAEELTCILTPHLRVGEEEEEEEEEGGGLTSLLHRPLQHHTHCSPRMVSRCKIHKTKVFGPNKSAMLPYLMLFAR